MYKALLVAIAGIACALPLPCRAAGPSFRPDAVFKGSSLTGWHTLGRANWRAENGELIGTPQQSGGWLVLDKPYQDVGLFANFKCTGGCETGVLFRAEQTPTGMKGVYISLNEPGLAFYNVTLDVDGKVLERTKLRPGGGQMRIAPPPPPTEAPRRPRNQVKFPAQLPFQTPDASVHPNEFNQIELLFDANILRSILNNGYEAGAVTNEGYGAMAFYVGGSGEVRFKDVAYTDLGLKTREPEKLSVNFHKQRLSDFYYSWGADAADFNHDGIMDVVSGPYVYFGPDYTKSREVYLAQTSNPSTDYTNDDWMQFAADFTGDGWVDALTCNFTSPNQGCFLFVNPKNENRRWDKFHVVTAFQTEIAMVKDVDGDGKPELVYGGENYVRYAKPDPANPTAPWVIHNVSEQGFETAHGIGVGDINGDGRMDIVNPYGWWEQPPAAGKQEPWTYHPEVFGRYERTRMGGSEIAIYDVNGDGLKDVVTVLNAHGWGLAWFEQKRDTSGTISFTQHMIMDDLWTKNAGDVAFSEGHGTTYADMNGDGVPDFVIGKRYWSHRDDLLDPNPYGPPVLYWYETVRDVKAPGGARFVPHLIDNQSGAGSNLKVADLNKDGAMDVVTATRFGTFIFWGTPHAGAHRARSGEPKAGIKSTLN